MDEKLSLRAFTAADERFLDRWANERDSMGEFEWPGLLDASRKRRRFEKDGYVSKEHTSVAVSLPDGTCVGVASYWPKHYGGPEGGCLEVGLGFLPEYRGRGYGVAAALLVVDYLFNYTTVHRLEGLSDEENTVVHRVNERAGMRLEGVLRGAYFHRGAWRNLTIWSILRDDYRPGDAKGE